MGGRRGLILVVVAGILGVLGVLALSFAALAQIERRASQQRLAFSRARLLARSGIEDALARLDGGQDLSLQASRYFGEDLNADGLLSSGTETAEQAFRPGVLDVETCPVERALRPSFPVMAGGSPELLTSETGRRGYSGRQSEEAGYRSNTYALKVEDESAKLNVNGGFLDDRGRDPDAAKDYQDVYVRSGTRTEPGAGRGWNTQLYRILGILGNRPEVGIPTLGTDVLALRPAGGYASISQLQGLIGASTDLSPWLTVSGWIDRGVIHPNGWSAPWPSNAAGAVPSTGRLKRYRIPLALEEGGRPPVNLNLASLPVLAALVQGLEAQAWQPSTFAPTGSTEVSVRFDAAMAASIVQALITRRPFRTWSEFELACDALVPTAISGFNIDSSPSGAYYGGGNLMGPDLLKANFNPNTQSNKEVPDQLIWKWIDKTDLVTWSTEGSLYPTGDFRISSVGRVVGMDGRLLAQVTLSVRESLYTLTRQSSQRDFLAGRSPQDCLGLGDDPYQVQRTFGAGASWHAWSAPQGLGAVTYPCHPLACPPYVTDAATCAVDGRIALATVEPLDTDASGNPLPLTFCHRFDSGWDSDATPTVPVRTRVPGIVGRNMDNELCTSLAQPVWPTAASAEPASLYPDGMHGQPSHSPCFTASEAFPATGVDQAVHATVSYWVKPCMMAPQVHLSVLRCAGNTAFSQVFSTGLFGSPGLEGWYVQADKCRQAHPGNLPGYGCGWEPPVFLPGTLRSRKPGCRWHLITARFDTNETTSGNCINTSVKDLQGTYPNILLTTTFSGAVVAEDLLSGFPGSPTDLVLGEQSGVGPIANLSTGRSVLLLDELAIADFGDMVAGLGGAQDRSDGWAMGRWTDGRYYKGEGRFLSAPLLPWGSGSQGRLLRAWWTGYIPPEPRKEMILDQNLTPMKPAVGTGRLLDPFLPPDRCHVDLDLLDGVGTLAGPSLQGLSQGGRLDRILPSFCYRVRIRADLANPLDEPILESPVFEDATFAWQALSGPRVLSWGAP